MTFSDILTALGQLAFPIVGCVALFYELHQNNARREEELKSLRKILNDNTDTLKELVEYLKCDKK